MSSSDEKPPAERPRRAVILTDGYTEPLRAKTASCILRYRPEQVAALLDRSQAGKTAQALLGVGGATPVIENLADAPDANTLVIGIAPAGGRVPPEWREILLEALGRGMDVVSGLHEFLSDDPQLVAATHAHGGRLIDVRKNSEKDVAHRQGIREDCLRIQTVGNDCSVGKMVAAIEVARALCHAGHDAKFVATGQTGIMVEGDGCPVDCVVSDFVNGAAEKLVLQNQHHDILLIEGQGSIAHPRYSCVTFGLLHGAMPHGLILCYEAGRTAVHGMPQIPLQPLSVLRTVYETTASLMHPARIIGLAVNTSKCTAEQAQRERMRVRDEMQLPVCDVIRDGPGELVQAVLDLRSQIFTATP